MSIISIQRIGGLAGLGGPKSRIVSRAEIQSESLTEDDRHAVEALFASPAVDDKNVRDGFRYRITLEGKTIEVPESAVPAALIRAVRDEFV